MMQLCYFLPFVLAAALACEESAPTEAPSRALILAAFRGNKRAVASILERKADPNVTLGAYDKDLLSRAGHASPIGSANWNALIAVAHSECQPDDQIAIARILIDSGAKVQTADAFGITALHQAILSGNVELALFLIKRGAPLNGQTKTMLDDADGETPLHLAVGHPIIVEALLNAGCDPKRKTTEGETALDYAHKMNFSESSGIIEAFMNKLQK